MLNGYYCCVVLLKRERERGERGDTEIDRVGEREWKREWGRERVGERESGR